MGEQVWFAAKETVVVPARTSVVPVEKLTPADGETDKSNEPVAPPKPATAKSRSIETLLPLQISVAVLAVAVAAAGQVGKICGLVNSQTHNAPAFPSIAT